MNTEIYEDAIYQKDDMYRLIYGDSTLVQIAKTMIEHEGLEVDDENKERLDLIFNAYKREVDEDDTEKDLLVEWQPNYTVTIQDIEFILNDILKIENKLFARDEYVHVNYDANLKHRPKEYKLATKYDASRNYELVDIICYCDEHEYFKFIKSYVLENKIMYKDLMSRLLNIVGHENFNKLHDDVLSIFTSRVDVASEYIFNLLTSALMITQTVELEDEFMNKYFGTGGEEDGEQIVQVDEKA